MLSTVYLAAEDEIGLAVGRKLIAEAPLLTIYREENGHGFGQLKVKCHNFQKMAAHFPVLMLTDLDNCQCPSAMIKDWLALKPAPAFLFRICVREVEAWLMAHREAIAQFMGVRISQIPVDPESLIDPKAKLISLSQQSKQRKIRTGFNPVGSATIGPEYNQLLGNFILDYWDINCAAQIAPSLQRARHRIQSLAASVSD